MHHAKYNPHGSYEHTRTHKKYAHVSCCPFTHSVNHSLVSNCVAALLPSLLVGIINHFSLHPLIDASSLVVRQTDRGRPGHIEITLLTRTHPPTHTSADIHSFKYLNTPHEGTHISYHKIGDHTDTCLPSFPPRSSYSPQLKLVELL